MGRTRRAGREGRCVCLVRPRESRKLRRIGEALGLRFRELGGKGGGGEEGGVEEMLEEERGAESSSAALTEEEDAEPSTGAPRSWAHLSESSLTRKTIAELTEYLAEHGISVPKRPGKKRRKADFVAAATKLHARAAGTEEDTATTTAAAEAPTMTTWQGR